MSSQSVSNPSDAAILVITGASGVGKTATVHALGEMARGDINVFHFDSIGVPPHDQMIREHGSPEGWQAAKTLDWINRLANHPNSSAVAVLEGQMRPTYVLDALLQAKVRFGRVVLFDCASNVRTRRLVEGRGQPDLVVPRMDTWAAYLRGQADALMLPVIDTTRLSLSAAVEAVLREVDVLRRQVEQDLQ